MTPYCVNFGEKSIGDDRDRQAAYSLCWEFQWAHGQRGRRIWNADMAHVLQFADVNHNAVA